MRVHGHTMHHTHILVLYPILIKFGVKKVRESPPHEKFPLIGVKALNAILAHSEFVYMFI
jgi:hypothetical protein